MSVYHSILCVCLPRLASIEKFSRFSRLIELNVQALKQSCSHLCHSSGEMMSSVNFLGKDIQRMARGIQPAARGVTYLYNKYLC